MGMLGGMVGVSGVRLGGHGAGGCVRGGRGRRHGGRRCRADDPVRPLDVLGVVLLVAAAAVTAAFGGRRRWRRWRARVLVVNAYLLAGYPYGPVLLCLVIAVFEVARQRPLLGVGRGLRAGRGDLLGDHPAPADRGPARHRAAGAGLDGVDRAAVVARRADPRAGRGSAARPPGPDRPNRAGGADAAGGEVHDIAGHGFALVTMQAGVALLVFDEAAGPGRGSLEAIRETSATALADLRGMLDTFHPAGRPPSRPGRRSHRPDPAGPGRRPPVACRRRGR